MEQAITADRATAVRRLLWVALGCALVLAGFAVAAGVGGNRQYATTLGISAVVLAAAAAATLRSLRSLRGEGVRARRGAIVTGVLLLVLALPAVQVWIGLLMAIAGVGMLFVTLSREPEA